MSFFSKSTAVRREMFEGYMFIAPAVLLIGLFVILPALMSFGYSLTNFYILEPNATEFVKFENYQYLFSKDSGFYDALRNTLMFVVMVVPLQTAVSLVLALFINKKMAGVNLFRTIFYSPVILSMVVVSILWAILYNRNAGLINAMLAWLGLPSQPFLESAAQAMPCIVAMSVWQGAGYQMIIFLAGLQGISPSLYEAAEIDGANAWKKFVHITLPGLYNVTVFVLMMTGIFAFGLFTQPYIMTQGGPNDSTRTLIMMFFEEGFKIGEVGTGSAIVVVYFLIVLAFTLLQKYIAGERNDSVV